MGKTSDKEIKSRLLIDKDITADLIAKCSKSRNSYKCPNDSSCYAAFGDPLSMVATVKQVSDIHFIFI